MRNSITVEDSFVEIGTRTIDDRNRLTLGEVLKGCKRVRIFKNARGEVLLQPLVEIPVHESWLFRNKEALKSVERGLEDAARGRITKIDVDEI